jgi:signal peptidase I
MLDYPNYFNMCGRSMLPTLHPGEGVLIDPVIDKRELLIGDIIVFPDPRGSEKNIIHRVIDVCETGYKTQGDNNRREDDYIVKFEMVRGKAVSVRRRTRTFQLSEGVRGFQLHRKLQRKKLFMEYILKAPSLISGIIDDSRIFNIFHRFVRVDVVQIRKGSSYEKILIHNNKLIGKQCRHTGKFLIKFPYKYFIDKKRI